MSSIAHLLKRTIQVQGRDVVLVPDIVGAVPINEQHQYVEAVAATNICPAIFVRESDIEEMRDRHPDTPVYGMWSVLIQSGLVSQKRTLQIVPISECDGYYIHSDLGRLEYSGIYEAGFFAADASFNLDEAQLIDASVDQLVLPEREAQLAAEIRQARMLASRKGWSYLVIVLMLIGSTAFGTDLALQSIYANQSKEIRTKSKMLKELQTGLDKLRTTRLSEVPNDSVAIERIAVLSKVFPNLETSVEQSFTSDNISFNVSGVMEDPAKSFDWLQSRYDPKGIWTVTFARKD